MGATGYTDAALADEPVMLLTGDGDGEKASMADVVDPEREVIAHGSAAPATTPDGSAGVDLDGRTDYLEVDGEDLSIAGTGQLTVEILMRPDKVKDLEVAAESSEGPMVHVLTKGRQFGADGDQEWATRVYDTTTKGKDGWGTVTMYRDGLKVDTDTLGGDYQVTPTDGGAPLLVGGGADEGRFDGAIGVVAIYPTALDAGQVAAHAKAALTPDAGAGAADTKGNDEPAAAAGEAGDNDDEQSPAAPGAGAGSGEQRGAPAAGARAIPIPDEDS